MPKRHAAFMLAVIVMASFALTPALSEGDRYTAARDRLFDDLLDYIETSESIWANNLWLMDAFDCFDSERSWESLQTARVALYLSRQALTDCSLPETTLSRDDYFALMDMGIDVSFMDYNPAIIEGNRVTNIQLYDNLHYFLMQGMLLEEDWENCRQKIAFERKRVGQMIRYLALTADWTMAVLNDPEGAVEFDRRLAERCPMTYAYRSKGERSIDDINASIDALLIEMDDLVDDEAAVDGAMQHRLKVMTDAVETEEYSVVREDVLSVSDMPPMIPWLAWFSDKDIVCVWNDNGAGAPSAGDVPLAMPDEWRISMEGVDDPKFEGYLDRLRQIGTVCAAAFGDENTVTYACEYEGRSFSVIREGENVTFVMTGDAPEFVPNWYWQVINASGR